MKCFCSLLVLPVFVLLMIVNAVYADNEIDYELVLCENIQNNLPEDITDSFNTGSKIYAYLYIDNIKNGIHKIAFYWYNTSNNKLQESYVKEITVTEEAYNIWSWLKLKDSKILFDTSFIGRWKVKIYIDDNFLTEKYFTVT